MKKAIVFEAVREGYGIDQISNPMTVGELREILDAYNDDTLFVLSHDNGYTYGSVSYSSDGDAVRFAMQTGDGDDEWELVSEDDFYSCDTPEDYYRNHKDEMEG